MFLVLWGLGKPPASSAIGNLFDRDLLKAFFLVVGDWGGRAMHWLDRGLARAASHLNAHAGRAPTRAARASRRTVNDVALFPAATTGAVAHINTRAVNVITPPPPCTRQLHTRRPQRSTFSTIRQATDRATFATMSDGKLKEWSAIHAQSPAFTQLVVKSMRELYV